MELQLCYIYIYTVDITEFLMMLGKLIFVRQLLKSCVTRILFGMGAMQQLRLHGDSYLNWDGPTSQSKLQWRTSLPPPPPPHVGTMVPPLPSP